MIGYLLIFVRNKWMNRKGWVEKVGMGGGRERERGRELWVISGCAICVPEVGTNDTLG